MLRGKTFGSDDSDPSSNKGLDTSKWKKKKEWSVRWNKTSIEIKCWMRPEKKWPVEKLPLIMG